MNDLNKLLELAITHQCSRSRKVKMVAKLAAGKIVRKVYEPRVIKSMDKRLGKR